MPKHAQFAGFAIKIGFKRLCLHFVGPKSLGVEGQAVAHKGSEAREFP